MGERPVRGVPFFHCLPTSLPSDAEGNAHEGAGVVADHVAQNADQQSGTHKGRPALGDAHAGSGGGTAAVSYTHLDVYKRQPLVNGVFPIIILLSLSMLVSYFSLKSIRFRSLVSVSYTHLSVPGLKTFLRRNKTNGMRKRCKNDAQKATINLRVQELSACFFRLFQ